MMEGWGDGAIGKTISTLNRSDDEDGVGVVARTISTFDRNNEGVGGGCTEDHKHTL